MAKWQLDDIAWHTFDAAKVSPELVLLVKAACMVEHNSADYADYLCNIFTGDAEFQQAARDWAVEEVQHGEALRKWAELADPTFNFDESFSTFTTGYQIPLDVNASVRGSLSGELIARCVVETGTSSYYTAIKEYSDEPVLKAICAKIAADELRHFKLFYSHLDRYLKKENLGFFKRLRVALGRITESEDDELAYAFFAANGATYAAKQPGGYNHEFYKNTYMAYACQLYRRYHIDSAMAMVFKAIGLKPHSRLQKAVGSLAWRGMQWRKRSLRNYLELPDISVGFAPAIAA